jgi:hypothetical protein
MASSTSSPIASPLSSRKPKLSSGELLAVLQSDASRARQELAALRSQLESIKYAADLTRDEVARRSLPASPSAVPCAPAPSASPRQIEAQLLEAKGAAAIARKRVEQLYFHAQTLRRRTRIDATDGIEARTNRASPVATRRKSKRNIADFDALVAPSSERELLPCRVTVSVDCVLSVYGVTVASGSMSAATEPLLQLFPPFSRVSDITPVTDALDRSVSGRSRPLYLALANWMWSSRVRRKSPLHGSDDVYGRLCGVRDAVTDAHALINGRGRLRGDVASDRELAVSVQPDHGEKPQELSKRPIRFVQGRGVDKEFASDGTPSVQIVGGQDSAVLSEGAMLVLVKHAPARFAGCSLRLLYSTRMHGMSLSSFYQRAVDASPTIVAISDARGARFGCFVISAWKQNPRPSYYGSGESFCWKGTPDDGVDIHSWSRENNYFQCSTAEFLAVGGGGHYAIRIDADLEYGTSGECVTFGNPCLASGDEFECVVLELWGFEVPRLHLPSSSSLMIV